MNRAVTRRICSGCRTRHPELALRERSLGNERGPTMRRPVHCITAAVVIQSQVLLVDQRFEIVCEKHRVLDDATSAISADSD